MAVTCVHDYIIAAMSCHSELPHFHTNEMLCKTFENILCLELCDGDVQDQVRLCDSKTFKKTLCLDMCNTIHLNKLGQFHVVTNYS